MAEQSEAIPVRWRERFPDKPFSWVVCMYINDCMQYLIDGNVSVDRFEPTENEDLIYDGLRELKDLAMQANGDEPLDWKGN